MGEENKVALLAGASGLTGGHLLEALLEAPDFGRIYAITRRPLGREQAKLANRIVQFDRLEAQLKGLSCHTAFCCLGGSLRTAGSERALRQVEVEYVVAFARAARAAQAQRFVLLSCATSALRPECEAAVEALGFVSLDILQPGPLLGLRRDMSPGQLLQTMLLPLARPFQSGARASQRAISTRIVAAAMLGAARSGRRGVYRYTYEGIRALAGVVAPPRARPRQGA